MPHMELSAGQRKLLYDLLRQNAKLRQARDFLEERQLAHSAGSWDDMVDHRLERFRQEGSVTDDDLVTLLRETEEFGRQHVFLYTCDHDEGAALINRSHLRKELKRRNLESLLVAPLILDMPESPRLVDARLEEGPRGDCLTLKVVEGREHRERLDQTQQGRFLTIRYEVEQFRAVNVLRLHEDGLLEVRVYSHRTSTIYQDELQRLWALADGLLQRGLFSELTLGQAKNRLWEERANLASRASVRGSLMRNANGTSLQAACGRVTASLVDDAAAAQGLDRFLQQGGGYTDAIVVEWFGASDDDDDTGGYTGAVGGGSGPPEGPQYKTTVRLGGQPHEFSIGARCSRLDYEFVLDTIRRFND